MIYNKEYMAKRLESLGFATNVLERYEEHQRFYHTIEHLSEILNELESNDLLKDDDYFLATIYHDAIYIPQSSTNEQDSATLFEMESNISNISNIQRSTIISMILDTKKHTSTHPKSKMFIEADLAIFKSSLYRLVKYENQIFKEFQYVPYFIYKEERVKVLEHFKSIHEKNIEFLINYVKCREPKIGIFLGSFNPFHKGHYDILEKAEAIFDKVIIGFGKNLDKNNKTWDIPDKIKNRQITHYDGLLTDHIEKDIIHDVTLIRGLRNITDFAHEQNQCEFLKNLKPDIKICYLSCDFDHQIISSSAIRTLEKYGKHKQYML